MIIRTGYFKDVPLLYATTVDISDADGPSINEREFVFALQRQLGDAVRFVLPRPKYPQVVDGLFSTRLFWAKSSRLVYPVVHLALMIALMIETRHRRPGMVVVRCGQLPLGLALFMRWSNLPMAIKTQGDPTMKYLCDQPGIKGWISRRLRPVNMWAVRILVKRAIAVDCCTPQLIERNLSHLAGVSGKKFSLIENATNTEFFHPLAVNLCRSKTGLQAFTHVIGYVGGVPLERGGKLIIHAVARLKERYPALGCAIVGGGGMEDLRDLASELGVLERCVIPGQVPYENVPIWINSFDVGVAMDLAERAGYVGSSNQKIRQYLACGKPVIASGGVNEFLVSNDLGITLPPDDIEAFVRAVSELLDRSAQQRDDFARRAREYAVQNLSVEGTLQARLELWSARLSAIH